MMQDFRPDCTIRIEVESRGREKNFWKYSLTGREGLVLVEANANQQAPFVEAELKALFLALEQATRLKQEKVYLNFHRNLDWLDSEAKTVRGLPESVQSLSREIRALWQAFRLRKFKLVGQSGPRRG